MITNIPFGGKVMKISSQVVKISLHVRTNIEKALVKIQDETNSKLIRLDMSPWNGMDTPPIYEVEMAPGGLMFWGIARSRCAQYLIKTFPGSIAPESPLHALVLKLAQLPWSVRNLASVAMLAPEYNQWAGLYKMLSIQTGWRFCNQWDQVPRNVNVYFSGTEEAIEPVSSRGFKLITDPFSSKVITLKITGGMVLNGHDDRRSFDYLIGRYPGGFAIKPPDGFGTRDVSVYASSQPFKSAGCTKSQMQRALNSDTQFMAQPFFPPQIDEVGALTGKPGFVAWRIFAVRSKPTQPFRLIGGVWNYRPKSLIIHGQNDAVVGNLVVS